ncbi:hypothetical protein DFH08DRAFT_1012936 [Mycena albidolilacea]|uniref:Uncharacterized protein n=1 Tax=Mycena albidolilacea TaxID=1033008 RepID=A0AAD6ZV09_9AGAR|nr:hypothetical protein DFH08DRAFT_1012936 [Mycena albidolilacea]
MAAKTRKRKSTPTATARVRRSTRPSRPPRRPDDEFSAATVAAEEPVSTLMEVSPTQPEPFTANSVLDTRYPQLGMDSGGESNMSLERTLWAPLGSRRNLIIDPLGSYPGEVNPTDPAVDIIRQLFAILPAPNVSLPAVELESASAMEPVGIPPAQTSVTELELGVETENAAPEQATQGQGASASLEIVAPVPTDIQPAHQFLEPGEENLPTVLYWVGVISAPGHQTVFCIPGPVIPPPTHRAGGIIDFLISANGPAGRALVSLSPASQFRVGISRVPEDMNNDFMAFRTGFDEVGHLDAVVMAPADSARVLPARNSDLRTAVLSDLGLGDHIPLLVLYVYPENTNPLAIQPPIAPALVQPTNNPLVLAGAVPNPINRYLDSYHAAKKAELRTLLDNQGYQSAYKHCLIERQVMSVCAGLGIVFSSRQIVAAQVNFEGSTIEIRPDDIATWMGISTSQFATCRTEVTAARSVHLLLRQLVLQQNVVTPAMEPRHLTLLATLNSLMSNRILSPVNPNGGYAAVIDLQPGDANASWPLEQQARMKSPEYSPCMPPEGGVPPRFHAVLGTRGTVIVAAEATLKPKIDISTSGARSAIIVGANAISGRLKPKVDFLTSGGRGTVIVGLNDVPLMLPTALGARGTVIVGANAISGPLKPKIDVLTSGARGTVIVGANAISGPLKPKIDVLTSGARSAIIVGANAISGRLKPKVDFLTSGGRGTVIVGLNDVPLMLPTALGARGTVIVGANAISGPLKPKIDVLTSGCSSDATHRARCSRDHHRPPQCDFRVHLSPKSTF